MGHIRPHGFRHEFATAVLNASGGNLLFARDAGGWASTAVVDEIYAHVDIHDPAFETALMKVWGQR
ncbi:tyrosine-type recombinase/integrase [Actinomadura sp. NPDC023710]|uniref:tyrosine-type recombinase/integrase n=1 Tax=Actinomadura sp. NPDC023710 TaxID=3158219 RepID=UPI0033C61CC7